MRVVIQLEGVSEKLPHHLAPSRLSADANLCGRFFYDAVRARGSPRDAV